jgi:hypothetical protein
MATAALTTNVATPARIWGGRVLTALPSLALGVSGAMKLARPSGFLEKWTDHFGFPESTLLPVALLELFVLVMYAVPRTRVLGAILVTGYLGGAMVTHVRVGEPFVIPLLLGVMAWGGVYLSDARLSELLPLRSPR